MGDHRLTVAEWLLESGAGASAVVVLADLLGQRPNEMRRLARAAELRPRTVYGLVTLPGGEGCVVPLIPSPGRSRAADPALRQACDVALEIARRTLNAPSLPALRFACEEWLQMSGASLGLPAALAFLGYYAPSRLPDAAILATGRLADEQVRPVDGLDAKRAAADAERGRAILLCPADTPDLTTAVSRVFGSDPLAAERHVLTLDETIEDARRGTDHAASIALLEALPLEAHTGADRARILLELGTLHRHVGQSRSANELHEQARSLLDQQRRILGGDAAERYELECWLSAMDNFQIEKTIEALEARLAAPFLNAHNEVRCRGMLAQGLGMAGRYAEAVEVRTHNVELQQSSDALRAVLPGTFCYLASDSARAGDAAGFERWARQLADATTPGAEVQARFNATAIVKGLVALDRNEEAVQWLRDERSLFGMRVPSSIHRAACGAEPVSSHPETTVLRLLARAFRRLARTEEAAGLAPRVKVEAHLLGWLAQLVLIEIAIDRPEDLQPLQQSLTSLHASASGFHADLCSARGEALECALDRVWY